MRRLVALVLLVGLTGACSFGGGSTSADYVRDDCTPQPREGHSVARVWDEALLHAIERDTPAPTVHARNLFHVSAAMWDAWAAYDPQADGWLVREKADADDVRAARETALSYAAYRLLLHRYSYASGLQETFDELVSTLEGLCYRLDYVETEGDSPAALGNRIAAAYIERGREDGANEAAPLRGSDLQAGQPAARRRGARDEDERPEQLAAARARPHRGAERHPAAREACSLRRSALGPRTRLRAACLRRRRPDRPGRSAEARGRRRPRVQARRAHRDQPQRRARSPQRRLARHRAGRAGRQLARRERRPRARRQSRHREALRPERRASGRLRSRAGRVLGGRPALRDAAGALELRRERDLRLAGARRGGSAGAARRSTAWSGTSSSTSRSTAPSTTRRSPPGA